MGQSKKARRWGLSRKGSEKSGIRLSKVIESEERYYHWYNELDGVRLTVDFSYLRYIVKREMENSGIKDLHGFYKSKRLSKWDRRLYKKWMNMRTGVVVVKNLKRFCEQFGIDLKELEQRDCILEPCHYPLDMKSREFLKAKTHIINEGLIVNYKVGYVNQDPVLIKYFADVVDSIRKTTISKPRLHGYAISIYANPVLGRALEASGFQGGKKTIVNPPLDPLILKNKELVRYHIQTTLTEEGWSSLNVLKRRVKFRVAWGRSVDITERLSSEQIEQLKRIEQKHKWKIPIKSIEDPKILIIIREKYPQALFQELAMLKYFHKDKEWPGAHPTRVHVSKDGKVTSFWEVHITRSDLIDLIHDEYGMLTGTWKAERFKRLYETYSKYRGRTLSDEEVKEVRKIKEENPSCISVEWISQKMRELFPDITWGGNAEEIRRKLRRK